MKNAAPAERGQTFLKLRGNSEPPVADLTHLVGGGANQNFAELFY